ncbi:hypothetical protein Tco_0918816 [Tanacetum coccineum]
MIITNSIGPGLPLKILDARLLYIFKYLTFSVVGEKQTPQSQMPLYSQLEGIGSSVGTVGGSNGARCSSSSSSFSASSSSLSSSDDSLS